MTAHTLGPWRFAAQTSAVWRTYFDDQGRRCHTPICDAVGWAGFQQPERDANGRLIAAAPALLGAATLALESEGLDAAARDALQAAVDAALKESA